MQKLETLVNQILNSRIPLEIDDLRNQVNNLVFSYNKSSILKKLCYWNNIIDLRMEHIKENLEIPGNKENVLAIIDCVASLEAEIKA
ncbi:hypothetical protein [Flavobacterium sp.]|uniref:hypothetical protein n=1 Tax=Flavobacterium sp. TaxID=239 RepID=UPI00286E322C|nr:hypothetical protein [Flavobacterium sp.]